MSRIILAIIFLISISCDRNTAISSYSTSTEISQPGLISDKDTSKIDVSIVLQKFNDAPNTLANRQLIDNSADKLYQSGLTSDFKKYSFLLLQKSSVARDSILLTKAYKNLGTYYIELGQNDSSYFFYTKAEKLADQTNNTTFLGSIYLDIAFILLYESDFTGSEIAASKALIFLDQNKLYQIYDAYNLLGIASNEMQNFDKALEYHNKAYQHYLNNNLISKNHLGASSLNNIGYVYQNVGNHVNAIDKFRIALQDPNLQEDSPGLYAMLLDNLAYSKFKLKDYKDLPQLYLDALAIREAVKTDLSGIILNKIHLSEFYLANKDTSSALRIAKDALQQSRKTEVAADILTSLNHLSIVDHKSASIYTREYIKISDSLQKLERRTKDKFARIQYETNEINSEREKLAEQNRTLYYFFIGTFMIGILLFVIRAQRTRNRELLLKQAQQKANEEIYNLMINQQNIIEESRQKEKKRIAQELHDGVLGRLFGTRLNLDSLNKVRDDAAIDKRNKYLIELRNIEQDIREISHDLNREKYVLVNNFTAILNNLIEEQENSFKISILCSIDEKIRWDDLGNVLKINLYRIIQECLQNIHKYADAKTIQIEIKLIGNYLQASIIDDGIGFDRTIRKKGIGIQNMISRANELDGTVDIRTKKGKGTAIIINFPLLKLGISS